MGSTATLSLHCPAAMMRLHLSPLRQPRQLSRQPAPRSLPSQSPTHAPSPSYSTRAHATRQHMPEHVKREWHKQEKLCFSCGDATHVNAQCAERKTRHIITRPGAQPSTKPLCDNYKSSYICSIIYSPIKNDALWQFPCYFSYEIRGKLYRPCHPLLSSSRSLCPNLTIQ